MNIRFAALAIVLALIPSSPLLASGKKDNKAEVSFHMETEATDNPKMIFPQMANGKTRYFRRMPEISTKDIVSFSPFPSEFGEGDYGLLVVLKESAAGRLSAITTANQGRWLISRVNGRVMDGVLIEKTVNDGKLVIWKGVTLADIALLDETFPRIGQEGKKKKK